MPKMSNVSRVISMTKSDSWTTNFGKFGQDEYKQFCYDKCPHKDKPCEGDCPEMKEYRRTHKRRCTKNDKTGRNDES